MSNTDWSIVIAPERWIFAGRVTREADQVVIRDAWIVRRYSYVSRDGLAGLAHRGPGAQENDQLERCHAPVRLHVLSLIASIECTAETWDAWHATQIAETVVAPKPKTKR